MTDFPTGDRGQRYEIHAIGYPKEGDCVIGWAVTAMAAFKMASAILLAPGASSAYVLDREDGERHTIEAIQ